MNNYNFIFLIIKIQLTLKRVSAGKIFLLIMSKEPNSTRSVMGLSIDDHNAERFNVTLNSEFYDPSLEYYKAKIELFLHPSYS